MIRENLNDVKENIVSACRASNRQPQDVTLIAVSKTKPVELLREAYDAGIRTEEAAQLLLPLLQRQPLRSYL